MCALLSGGYDGMLVGAPPAEKASRADAPLRFVRPRRKGRAGCLTAQEAQAALPVIDPIAKP